MKISKVVDGLAGDESSLLSTSSEALQDTIASNELRLEQFKTQLTSQEERLTNQFYQLELIIAKLQQSQSALNDLQAAGARHTPALADESDSTRALAAPIK